MSHGRCASLTPSGPARRPPTPVYLLLSWSHGVLATWGRLKSAGVVRFSYACMPCMNESEREDFGLHIALTRPRHPGAGGPAVGRSLAWRAVEDVRALW
jgi:hypothetical protein